MGSRVKIGYFSQQHEGLDPSKTILDEICYTYGLDEETARGYLGAFLFHGDDVQRLIGALSGGEQARVAFLKLMLTGANFLVLDEPTNHLDIPAREAVEEALMAFPGTFIAVSHDRYFLDKTANCTLELSDGKITEYLGNYSYYLMKKEAEAEEAAEERSAEKMERPAPAQEQPRAEKTAPKAAVHSAIPAARRQEMRRARSSGAQCACRLRLPREKRHTSLRIRRKKRAHGATVPVKHRLSFCSTKRELRRGRRTALRRSQRARSSLRMSEALIISCLTD